MEPTAIDFQVWQDFMPGPRTEGPPLHATVSFQIEGVDVSSGSGSITIRRANGEQIAASSLELARWADDLGLKYPGPQQVTLNMTPVPVSVQLVENEMVKGSANVKLGSKDFAIELPETPVVFAR